MTQAAMNSCALRCKYYVEQLQCDALPQRGRGREGEAPVSHYSHSLARHAISSFTSVYSLVALPMQVQLLACADLTSSHPTTLQRNLPRFPQPSWLCAPVWS